MADRFKVIDRLRSFSAAAKGLRVLLIEEHNARVHLAATIVVVLLAFFLGASRYEWLILTLLITLVWVAEALNTAVENLADKVSPEHDPLIAKAKDTACLAVTIASVGAALGGLLIFLPLIF